MWSSVADIRGETCCGACGILIPSADKFNALLHVHITSTGNSSKITSDRRATSCRSWEPDAEPGRNLLILIGAKRRPTAYVVSGRGTA